MRLREIARRLKAMSSNSVSQPHVCEFNQSPWDVITDFSPPSSPVYLPSPKVNGNGLSGMIETFCASISLMEWEDCNVTGQDLDCMNGGDSGGAGEEKSDDRKGAVRCGKMDGKSLQCQREAKYGNSLCEHHIALASKNSGNQWCDKKKKYAALVETEGGKRKVQTKKASPAAANPYEMYYYSGFGPHWGKRRGEDKEDNGNDNNLLPKSLEHEPVKEPSYAKFMDEGLDYIEDDADEEEGRLGKRKRARKVVKARSLKSLV